MAETLIKCPSCGSTNRIRSLQPGRRALCGKCKTPLAATSPLEVTDGTFATEVDESPIPVLVDLWAEWCGPCHMLAPTVDQVAAEFRGRVKVVKLNIDDNPVTANRFGVRSIPTLLIVKAGREVDRLIGVQPKQAIVQRLERTLAG